MLSVDRYLEMAYILHYLKISKKLNFKTIVFKIVLNVFVADNFLCGYDKMVYIISFQTAFLLRYFCA